VLVGDTSRRTAAKEDIVGTWDRQRVEQIVEALLSNAIKYRNGKPIAIEVERTDGVARLAVRDQGMGRWRTKRSSGSSAASSAPFRSTTSAGSGRACGSRVSSRKRTRDAHRGEPRRRGLGLHADAPDRVGAVEPERKPRATRAASLPASWPSSVLDHARSAP
jgi:hypothetical protein